MPPPWLSITGKSGQTERGSSALRGAADVMIECSLLDMGLVQLECAKTKDAQPFKSATLSLEKVSLSNGQSSPAVVGWNEVMVADAKRANADEALKVLEQFGSVGATNGEWQRRFLPPRTKPNLHLIGRSANWKRQVASPRTGQNTMCDQKMVSVSKRCHPVS